MPATIPQGARSTVRTVTLDGAPCIEKRYNDRKDPPAVKLDRERAFYAHYDGLDLIPRLVSFSEPDTVVVSRLEGHRLIDLIQSGTPDLDRSTISHDLGRQIHRFFTWKVSDTAFLASGRAHIRTIIQQARDAAASDPSFQVPILEASLRDLDLVLNVEAEWMTPMACKVDWSAANTFVEDDAVTGLFDFDTAYPGTSLSFLGDVYRSCFLHLDPIGFLRGLVSAGMTLPSPDCLIAAASLSQWQVALADFHDNRFGWLNAERMRMKLGEIRRLTRSYPEWT